VTVPGLTATVRRWALTLAALAVLSVLVAAVVGIAGIFGFASVEAASGEQAQASVVTGASCSDANAKEVVSVTIDGKQRQARLDACGHAKGDPVTVMVPGNRATDAAGDLVVHSAQADMGVDDAWRPIGLGLLFLAGLAGGGYALLYLREPGAKLPKLPWVTTP
jgi:ferric-dicitrate binding protein FerR (iron transport regulator)